MIPERCALVLVPHSTVGVDEEGRRDVLGVENGWDPVILENEHRDRQIVSCEYFTNRFDLGIERDAHEDNALSREAIMEALNAGQL